MKLLVYPMDYEEFCDATGGNYELLRQIYDTGSAIGQATNRKLMRDLRIYMAVGGMPQAVESYTEGKNLSDIDIVNIQIMQKNIGFQQQSGRRVKQKPRNYYTS